jgi:hypothetical protein
MCLCKENGPDPLHRGTCSRSQATYAHVMFDCAAVAALLSAELRSHYQSILERTLEQAPVVVIYGSNSHADELAGKKMIT